MAAGAIPALGLITSVVKENTDAVKRAREISKQRFLREIASLFGVFETVDEQIVEINSSLQAFIEEEQVGMRVHYLHEAGVHFEEFVKTQDDFLEWMEKSRDIRHAIGIFSSPTRSVLERLVGEHADARGHVSTGIDNIRSELQAVASPDPAEFPAPGTVTEVMRQLASLSAEISYARKVISDFVCANFTMEDMFY